MERKHLLGMAIALILSNVGCHQTPQDNSNSNHPQGAATSDTTEHPLSIVLLPQERHVYHAQIQALGDFTMPATLLKSFGNDHELMLAHWQPESPHSVMDTNLIEGKEYSYRLKFRNERGTDVEESASIKIPYDRIFSGWQDSPATLNSPMNGRLFFDKATIRVTSNQFMIVADELIFNQTEILSFADNDFPQHGIAGLNGYNMKIQAKRARGDLYIDTRGQPGGAAPRIASQLANLPGASGGSSATLHIAIEENSPDLSLKVESRVAPGGLGSPPGRPGQPSTYCIEIGNSKEGHCDELTNNNETLETQNQ